MTMDLSFMWKCMRCLEPITSDDMDEVIQVRGGDAYFDHIYHPRFEENTDATYIVGYMHLACWDKLCRRANLLPEIQKSCGEDKERKDIQ